MQVSGEGLGSPLFVLLIFVSSSYHVHDFLSPIRDHGVQGKDDDPAVIPGIALRAIDSIDRWRKRWHERPALGVVQERNSGKWASVIRSLEAAERPFRIDIDGHPLALWLSP